MEKKIMIQTRMSLEDFALLQEVLKALSNAEYIADDRLYKSTIYYTTYDINSIVNLRRIFLPDIKII